MTSQQEEEYERMVLDMSLRYQLQPGRFRCVIPHQDRTLAYMVDAQEWIPAACRIVSIRRISDAEVIVIAREGMYRLPIEAIRHLIEDAIERAELGPEETEYLRGLPRVATGCQNA